MCACVCVCVCVCVCNRTKKTFAEALINDDKTKRISI